MSKDEQVHDGIPFDMKVGTPWSLQCCGCGLVHDVVLTPIPSKEKVRVLMTVQGKATRKARRTREIRKAIAKLPDAG